MPIPTGGIILRTKWCNIFGAESGGIDNVLGGLGGRPGRQWYCPTVSVGRFRMVCEHGHRGQMMELCQKHINEFGDKVTYCPRCNADSDMPGHKCNLVMESVS